MKFFIISNLLLWAGVSHAFSYFDHGIDYWDNPQPRPSLVEEKPSPKKEKEKEFDWSRYTDPKHDAFFREGDHLPPAPFMEVARNPTDANIKKWYAVIESKNLLMSRLQERLREFLANKGTEITADERRLINAQMEGLDPEPLDTQRFRFRLYISSTCGACKDMQKTMASLQQRGFYVEIRQIDRGALQRPFPFPLRFAEASELKEQDIESVPVLFVADSDKEMIYRIWGYQTENTILRSLSTK